MKVFWSWQSDTPGKIGRHLVRDALGNAITDLKVEAEVEESLRESAANLHLDHDRQGIPGSPDLARTIFDKIAQSTVFVADVTPVGATVTDKSQKTAKKLINSNVAIELGYALGKLGGRSLLMVMNGWYGERSDLPFDLQAKAGPIIFNLPQNANAAAIASANKSLRSQLKVALREFLRESGERQNGEQRLNKEEIRISNADWERMADKLFGSCRHLRADSQWNGATRTTVWRLAGPPNGICEALLKQAGAMLLKSPNVRSQLSEEVLSEPSNLNRWLIYLKEKGSHTITTPFDEVHEDGSRVTHLLGSIRDLPGESARICIECAALEMQQTSI
ncbi:MAG: hypothetical protein JOY95_14005 [Silvibacterium sp.]|nr:hypothetical protein [Silvibacterium sp.]